MCILLTAEVEHHFFLLLLLVIAFLQIASLPFPILLLGQFEVSHDLPNILPV